MAVFAVYLSGEADATMRIVDRLREAYPDPAHYEMSERFFFVRDDTITETIAKRVGIKGADQIGGAAGVIFKLNNSYSGYEDPALWEWLTLDRHTVA